MVPETLGRVGPAISAQTQVRASLARTVAAVSFLLIMGAAFGIGYAAMGARADKIEAAQATQQRDIDALAIRFEGFLADQNRQLQTISGTLTGIARELSELRGEVNSARRNP